MALLLCVLHYFGAVNVEVLRALLLIMIVFASLFLIVAGYSDNRPHPFSVCSAPSSVIFSEGPLATPTAAQPPPAQDAPSTKPPAGSK